MIEIEFTEGIDKDNINDKVNILGNLVETTFDKKNVIQLYSPIKTTILDFHIEKRKTEHNVNYFHFPHLVRFDSDPNAIIKNDTSNESIYIADKNSLLGIFYCQQSTSEIIQQTVFNILLKKIDERFLKQTKNNILIKGRKVFIEKTNNVIPDKLRFFFINIYYDHTLFQSILTPEELYGETGKGITGIQNEIPGYTKQQFLKDFYSEIGGIYES
jgi:hypothetical protein